MFFYKQFFWDLIHILCNLSTWSSTLCFSLYSQSCAITTINFWTFSSPQRMFCHLFVNFQNFSYSFLISFLVDREHSLCDFSPSNLGEIVLWPGVRVILDKVPSALEEGVCSGIAGYRALEMCCVCLIYSVYVFNFPVDLLHRYTIHCSFQYWGIALSSYYGWIAHLSLQFCLVLLLIILVSVNMEATLIYTLWI